MLNFTACLWSLCPLNVYLCISKWPQGRGACRLLPADQRRRLSVFSAGGYVPALSTKEFNTANNKEYDESQNFREGA
jgi:hypothetical protein